MAHFWQAAKGEGVASHLRPLLADPSAIQALDVLRRDFSDHGGVGPRRVAMFLTGGPNDEIQADVVGHIAALLATFKG